MYFVLESGCYQEQESMLLCSTASINNSSSEQFKMLLIGIVNFQQPRKVIMKKSLLKKSTQKKAHSYSKKRKNICFDKFLFVVLFFCY